jgi:cholesterol transport system auxiliary component
MSAPPRLASPGAARQPAAAPVPIRARRRRFGLALAGLAALVVAGCSSSSPLETFDLSVPPGSGRPVPRGRQIVVAEPVALQALESDRIVVRSSEGTISYVAGVQWADRLPRLLQSRIVQAFENSGRAVGRAGNGVAADAILQTDIRFFGVRTGEGALVELSSKLVDGENGRILGARVFRASTPLSGVSGPTAAAALDQAMLRVLGEIVRWSGGVRLGTPTATTVPGAAPAAAAPASPSGPT